MKNHLKDSYDKLQRLSNVKANACMWYSKPTLDEVAERDGAQYSVGHWENMRALWVQKYMSSHNATYEKAEETYVEARRVRKHGYQNNQTAA